MVTENLDSDEVGSLGDTPAVTGSRSAIRSNSEMERATVNEDGVRAVSSMTIAIGILFQYGSVITEDWVDLKSYGVATKGCSPACTTTKVIL